MIQIRYIPLNKLESDFDINLSPREKSFIIKHEFFDTDL